MTHVFPLLLKTDKKNFYLFLKIIFYFLFFLKLFIKKNNQIFF